MASVELSAGIMSGLPTRIISPTTGATSWISSGFLYSWPPLLPYVFYAAGTAFTDAWRYTGVIGVYQGSVPVDFSTLTAYNSRSADLLLSYTSWDLNQTYYSINITNNPAVINTAYNTASASGTATWFRWWVYGGSSDSFRLTHQIIGTVGATGSGADLEIPTTAIVVNRAYRIQNLRIQFPSSWSY